MQNWVVLMGTGGIHRLDRKKVLLMGRQAFKQSIYPYTKEPYEDKDIAIIGFDTEFYVSGKSNVLVSWQLGDENGAGVLLTSKLTVDNMVWHATKLIGRTPKKIFFFTYFIVAEAQFFWSPVWHISEYKGKYKFSTKHGNIDVQVIDLHNWFPREKLASVAKIFGLEKLEYPIVDKMNGVSKGKINLESLLKNKKFRDYAINDAVIVAKIVKSIRDFFLPYGVDILQTTTAAGTSASLFRKIYVPEAITQFNTKLRKLSLLASWGGRTECFYRGNGGECYNYDAFSHHPSSALQLGILPKSSDWERTSNVKLWMKMLGGLGQVHFKFPSDEKYPCLPVYDDGNLLFPLEGESCCSLSEAKYAAECGAKMVIIDAFGYNNGVDYLQQYLSWLFDMRVKAKDDVESRMIKLMMNSIVGKLFQKSLDSYDLNAIAQYAHEHGLPPAVAMQVIGLPINKRITVGSCFYPEWYALILGYARMNISRMAKINNALMISSDSLITKKKIKGVDDSIVYHLKNSGEYVGYRCKLYRVGDKYAHHGVHSREVAKRILDYFITDSSDILYDVNHIIMLKEGWKQGLQFGTNIQKYMSVSLGYDSKRKLGKDGNTQPWKNTEERRDFLCQNKDLLLLVKQQISLE